MTLMMSFSAPSSRKLSLEFRWKNVTNERETNDNNVRNLSALHKNKF